MQREEIMERWIYNTCAYYLCQIKTNKLVVEDGTIKNIEKGKSIKTSASEKIKDVRFVTEKFFAIAKCTIDKLNMYDLPQE